MASSSLSNVVSDLMRASMGSTVTKTVTDEDLDRHIGEIILREAKQKAEQYKKDGFHAYLPPTDSNAPRANKRFLSSIIRSTDDHNKAILRSQAMAAAELKEEREEQERRERRARADEAVKARLRGLMSGRRRDVTEDRWQPERDRERRLHKNRDWARDRSRSVSPSRKRYWDEDEDEYRRRVRSSHRKSRDDHSRSSFRSRSPHRDKGESKGSPQSKSRTRLPSHCFSREKDLPPASLSSLRKSHSTSHSPSPLFDNEKLREPSMSHSATSRSQPPTLSLDDVADNLSPRSRSRTPRRNKGKRRYSPQYSLHISPSPHRSVSPGTDLRNIVRRSSSPKDASVAEHRHRASNSRSRSPRRSKEKSRDGSTVITKSSDIQTSHRNRHSHTLRRKQKATPSPPPDESPLSTLDPMPHTPSPLISSKMDKYFSSTYDPRLDVAPLTSTSSELTIKVPATGLIDNAQFEGWDAMLELIRVRREDRAEKKRLERLGLFPEKGSEGRGKKGKGMVSAAAEDGRGIMQIEYTKKGAVREWDMGKETM